MYNKVAMVLCYIFMTRNLKGEGGPLLCLRYYYLKLFEILKIKNNEFDKAMSEKTFD